MSKRRFLTDAQTKRAEEISNAGRVFRFAMADAIEVQGQERTMRFTFSDGSVDRMDDTINPQGWELEEFYKNPVALWAHDSYSPPIGRASNLQTGDRLAGDITFAEAGVYPFAETIYQLVKNKFVNAVSVGFRPLEWSFSSDKSRPLGIDFKRQELLEISLVPIPANANALIDGKSVDPEARDAMIGWAKRALKYGGFTDDQIARIEAAVEKGGRRISKENMGRLQQASDHIKAVMDSNAAADDDGDDPDEDQHDAAEVAAEAAGETEEAAAPNPDEAKEKRVREARELRESLKL